MRRSRKVSENFRLNATERGYGPEWKRQAARFLAAHPLCLGCHAIGVRRPAELVDHIIPHRGNGGRSFWDSSNWQALCKWHHDAIKAELERLFHMKRLRGDELRMTSAKAIELTRQRYRPAIGADGFAIPGT